MAVKRVIPPKDSRNGKTGSMFNNSVDDAASKDQDLETGLKSGGLWSGMSSWGGMKSLQHKSTNNTLATKRNQSLNYKKLKEEFIEEMRYLAKLRHPCITTVMGKWGYSSWGQIESEKFHQEDTARAKHDGSLTTLLLTPNFRRCHRERGGSNGK